MTERRCYSLRTGKHPLGPKLDLVALRKLFHSIYADFERNGYFQQFFGYSCVDAGEVAGAIGVDIEAYFLIKLRKDNLWPIDKEYEHYSEEDLFDVIEFLHDHISRPIDGRYHQYGDCGWHYTTFDWQSGQDEYRRKVNELLRDYGEGYELSSIGEILTLVVPGTEILFENKPPEYDKKNVDGQVNAAVLMFRRYGSSLDDKKNAVRKLADVLEFLRPKLKMALTTADENDLFNIANNFGIRHHTKKQKTDYDQEIWLDWIFYYYLATINAAVRLIKKKGKHGTANS